jgi:hypothetical protein
MKGSESMSLRTARWPAFVAVLITLMCGSAPTAAMAAQSTSTVSATAAPLPALPCSPSVYDATVQKVIVRYDAPLMAIVNHLEAQGVHVYVRVIDRAPAGGTDALEKQLLRQCPLWRDGNQLKPAPRVLGIVMDLHHHITYFYDAAFKAKIQPRFEGINDQVARPYGEGDYVGAVTVALNDLSDVINGVQYPGAPRNWDLLWASIIGAFAGGSALGIVLTLLMTRERHRTHTS